MNYSAMSLIHHLRKPMIELETLLSELIKIPSITPHDAGCQAYLMGLLESFGFQCQRLDNPPVSNFFARFGTNEPLLLLAGHTDVVPVGDESKWRTPPFTLTNQNGMLYGRGTADMKGSLAAMVLAAKRFIDKHPKPAGSLGFLITSGEEGDHFHLGTEYAMAELHQAGIHPTYCIVGEPSSTTRVGDVVKIGRRGSLSAKLVLHGKQGHVAYPHLAENPIHLVSQALHELVSIEWDKGNQHFPPTSLQVTHLHAGGQAGNVITGELLLDFNIRYSTEQTEESIKQAVHDLLAKHQLHPQIEWRLSGQPFLTAHGRLLDSVNDAIHQHTGKLPELSTSGGTSDGRFIAPYGVEVIELGPVNASIHQVNECVLLADLEKLTDIYETICQLVLGGKT
jgi:succinyl-diaminopimelate desuccinylase